MGWGIGVAAVSVLTLGGVFATLLRRRYVVVTVSGRSMLPTLSAGQRALVRRCAIAKVKPDSLVVFTGWEDPRTSPVVIRADDSLGIPVTSPSWVVKRVLAVPGDPVPHADIAALAGDPHSVVPQASLVVRGDNPEESVDSRHYGYLTADRLIGTVVRVLP